MSGRAGELGHGRPAGQRPNHWLVLAAMTAARSMIMLNQTVLSVALDDDVGSAPDRDRPAVSPPPPRLGISIALQHQPWRAGRPGHLDVEVVPVSTGGLHLFGRRGATGWWESATSSATEDWRLPQAHPSLSMKGRSLPLRLRRARRIRDLPGREPA